jgi:nucleoside-diphosphate-sugar epimerase
MTKRILVTGAGGFVGQHVVRYLLEHGYRVRAMIRRPRPDLGSGIDLETIQGDMKDYRSVLSATRDIDVVVHLAAAKADETDSYDTNVIGAENLVRACADQKVCSIVVVSTISTKLQQKGLYAETKAKADKIFLAGNVPAIILRPSIIYGDMKSGIFGTLVRFSHLPVVPVIGSGKQHFAPIHVEDIARAIEIACLSPQLCGTIYDIGGPDLVTLNELTETIAHSLCGRQKRRLVHIPVFFGHLLARFMRLVMQNPPITISNVLGADQDVAIQSGEFFNDFGFIPRNLSEGFAFIKKENAEKAKTDEARLLLEYVRKGTGVRAEYPPEYADLYSLALRHLGLSWFGPEHPILRRPLLLGPLDAASRLWYPESSLQKKLTVAVALLECTKASANILLPKQLSWPALAWRAACFGAKGIGKLAIGTFLLPFIPKIYDGTYL